MNKNIEVVFLPTSLMLLSELFLTTDVEPTLEAHTRPVEVFFDGRLSFSVC